jgi:hypothetical protein
LKKQNNVGGLSICNFNTYHKATVNKEVCYWPKKRHLGQWTEQKTYKQTHLYKSVDFF